MFLSNYVSISNDTYHNYSTIAYYLVWIWHITKNNYGNDDLLFSILINFVDGLENVDKDYINLFKTMNASKLNTFVHLKLPMSLESLFTGLKISAAYAFVAATVAEWLGGSIGLGVYMVRAKSSYALDKVFASTILVIIFSLIFVIAIDILKKIILRHKYKGE